MRRYGDEFVINTRTNMCHRAFCQSAPQRIGRGWKPVSTPAEARKLGSKECTNCCPYQMLVGDTKTMILHIGKCRIAKTCKSRNFETVEEAYRDGFEFRRCCTPPGVKKNYLSDLVRMIEEEDDD